MSKIKSYTGLILQLVLPYLLVYGIYKYFQDCYNTEHLPYLLGFGLVWFFYWFLVPHYLIWVVFNGHFYTSASPGGGNDVKFLPNNKLAKHIKVSASLSMIKSALRGLVVMPFSISAFFVVPIIVLFVKRSEDKLPSFFNTLWGDKNGLDGDNYWEVRDVNGVKMGVPVPIPLNPSEQTKEHLAKISYFPGIKQRTWAYRVLWLLRNRATNMGVLMGGKIKDYYDYRYWGPKDNILSAPKGQMLFGLYLLENNGLWEVYQTKHAFKIFGKSFMLRRRFGFKVGNESYPYNNLAPVLRRKEIEVINISFSIKAYNPKDYKRIQ